MKTLFSYQIFLAISAEMSQVIPKLPIHIGTDCLINSIATDNRQNPLEPSITTWTQQYNCIQYTVDIFQNLPDRFILFF